MRTKIIITYNWNDGANGTVAKNHLETLDNIAEMNIREFPNDSFCRVRLRIGNFGSYYPDNFFNNWICSIMRIFDEPTFKPTEEQIKEYFKKRNYFGIPKYTCDKAEELIVYTKNYLIKNKTERKKGGENARRRIP